MIVRSLLAAAALSAALLLPSAAAAQETEREWYGWQNMFATYGSLSLAGVGLATEQDWLAGVGVAGYALGGPVVHLAHENYASAGISFGLNLGLPLGGGLLGVAAVCGIDGCRGIFDAFGALAGMIVGGIGGMVAASVIDAAVLSYGEKPVPAGTTASALGSRPAWVVPPLQLGGRF